MHTLILLLLPLRWRLILVGGSIAVSVAVKWAENSGYGDLFATVFGAVTLAGICFFIYKVIHAAITRPQDGGGGVLERALDARLRYPRATMRSASKASERVREMPATEIAKELHR
jgi:hypothetical protein